MLGAAIIAIVLAAAILAVITVAVYECQRLPRAEPTERARGQCSECRYYKAHATASLGRCSRYPEPVSVSRDYGCGEFCP